MMLSRYTAQAAFPRMYPPNPVMTTLLLPWLRVLYLAVKRQVYKQVFSGSASQRRSSPTEQSSRGHYGRPTTRMIVVGDDVSGAHLVDGNDFNDDTYETLDDGTLVPHGGWRDEAVSLDELEYRVFNEGELPTTIYVSFFSLSKLVVQSLTFPFISSLMGGLLGTASKFSSPLRRLLGIAPGIEPEPGCESWMSLLWLNPREPPLSSSAIARGAEPLWVDDLGAEYDDLDPVWYRNALGGALYILIKDGLVLLYRYLQVKQLRRRRIKNLPFSEGVARELMTSRP
ncbi:hypothetical protein MPSI1_002329 [Malassezia psittaci]|uniref:Uncharacterized protein n=1 Tax=Malassezia psittaci TaxID=1821823 RepID=A0AAF0JEK8_9BASI|nr:hypothetical protein MPSI1_002329 [Malassezia psittaci]